MRWAVFAIFAFLALVLESGLATLLSIGTVAPSFTLVLMVYVTLWAPRLHSAWAALVLGLLAGLQPGSMQIVGPLALGYLVGAYATLQVRGLVVRNSVIVLAAATLIAGLLTYLVAIALMVARSIVMREAPPLFDATDQVRASILLVIYSALLALPLGYLLHKCERWWAFTSGKTHDPRHRRSA